jgi:DNA-directed RNA polymerase I, II, and III subunit RPABC2
LQEDGDDGLDQGVDLLNADDVEIDQEAAKERVTTKYMTKYERARILGTRALQIRSALL